MQEKKDYERSVRMNEMGELLREQQAQIQERDDQLSALRNKQTLEASQKQLEAKASFAGQNSFFSNNETPTKQQPYT